MSRLLATSGLVHDHQYVRFCIILVLFSKIACCILEARLVSYVTYVILSKTSVTARACKALGRLESFLQKFVLILPGFSVLVVYSEKYDGSHIFTITCS